MHCAFQICGRGIGPIWREIVAGVAAHEGGRLRVGQPLRPPRDHLNAIVLFVVVMVFTLTTAVARSAPASIPPESPLPVSEIVDGVFVHFGVDELMTSENEGAIANVGFVVGEDAVAVIDTGGTAREGRRLLAAIRAVTTKPIRYVINTHAHPDHMFGNAAFARQQAIFVAHRNFPRALALRGQHYLEAFGRSMGAALDGVELIAPQQLVSAELKLDLGHRTLALHAWATAHSDNDLTILDEASETFFAGDLLFVRHIPVLDGSLLGWLTAMDGLSRIAAKRVVPGHGPVGEWPRSLLDERRYLERVAQDCRALIASGASLSSAAQQAGASEKLRWELFEEYKARNATAAFAELEWE